MDTTSTLDHYADDHPAIMPAAELPPTLGETPTAAELEEIAWAWRSACGDPHPDRSWPELSAKHGD